METPNEKCLIVRLREKLTSEYGLHSDIENCNSASHEVNKGISNCVVLKPCSAVILPVTELKVDDLKVDVEELIEAVAMH